MANKKISELTSATTPLGGTEEVEIVQSGVNKKVAVSNIGGATIASQSTVNTGSNSTEAVSPSTLKNLDSDAVALVDASSMALTAPKHTLTTSSATRTFTITFAGDEIMIRLTLNAISCTITFPSGALCVSEGLASGDNLLSLSGASGDIYRIGISKVGSAYEVIGKNFGQ